MEEKNYSTDLENNDDDVNKRKCHNYYFQIINSYEKEFKVWQERSNKIVKRFRAERNDAEKNQAKYNVLWSNVKTLLPAYFSSTPRPEIDRRFKDSNDDVGRISSQILERCVTFFLSKNIFRETAKLAVMDRLLPGRGVCWVRYVPHLKDVVLNKFGEEISDDGIQLTDDADQENDENSTISVVDFEEVIPDYIYFEDFGHNIARSWQEVFVVWRKVYLDREELVERFGELGSTLPLDYMPESSNKRHKSNDVIKKSTIYEIWDKNKSKVYFLHKDHSEILDEKEDPLKLNDFFPCPMPLYATTTSNTLIPVPDYIEYQDQAQELDSLTSRIDAITRCVKVAGVYDASAEGIQRILSEGVENQLIPVEQWAMFAERGGLRGVIDFLPVKEIIEVLLSLYQARERVKQDLYEITGIADIVRGASNPNETATAQQIKGRFANLRIADDQKDVERFMRDLVVIMVEIIAQHFTIDTIKMISGIKLLSSQEKQIISYQIQSGIKVDPTIIELISKPSWEDIENLIRNQAALNFQIAIETNSTVMANDEEEKSSKIEFLTAVGGFLNSAKQISDPNIMPLLSKMLMFGVKAFRVSRDIESSFEEYISKLEQNMQNPIPQPNPEQEKIKNEMSLKKQKIDNEMSINQQKLNMEASLRQQKNILDTISKN